MQTKSIRSLFKLFACKILVMLPLFSAAQNQKKIDSLMKVLTTARQDTDKLNVLTSISLEYRSMLPENALKYSEEAFALSKKLNYKKGEIFSLNNIGAIYYQLGNYPKALDNYNKALKIAEEIKEKNLIPSSYQNIGNVYKERVNYSEALKYYYKAFELNESLGSKKSMAENMENMGLVFSRQGEYTKSIEYYSKASKLREEINDKKSVASDVHQIGGINLQLKQYDLAIKYFTEALHINKQNNNKPAQSINFMALGDAYRYIKKYNTALDYYMKALSIREEIRDKPGSGHCLNSIGSLHEEQKNDVDALIFYKRAYKIFEQIDAKAELLNTANNISIVYKRQSDLMIALEYINKALRIAQSIGMKENSAKSYSALSETYAGMYQYENAYKFYKLYSDLKDSLQNETTAKQIAEMQSKYETEKKEKEIEALTQSAQILTLENSKNRYIIYGLSGGGLLLIIISLLFIRQQKLKTKRIGLELEQKLLRSQMNPHFIFNALHSIQSFMYTNDIKESARYLSNFARLMRMILENSRHEYITMEKEISTLENYLALQQLRFENKFEFSVEVDPAIDKESMAIPPMFAQPFIENALEHGIKNKDTKGKIDIRFKISNGTILFEVEDNGIGRKRAQELIRREGKEHESLATAITNERIEAFNKKHSKKITLDIVDMDNNGEYGTKVVFRIPYKLVEPVIVSLN